MAGVCGRKVITNMILCTNFCKWTHGRCAKMKRATTALARHLVCVRWVKIRKGEIKPINELWDGVETVGSFCYLGDKLSTSRGFEVALSARTIHGWEKFRKCSELLF